MFRERNARAKGGDNVMIDVMPAIIGKSNPRPGHLASERNTIFGNLEPLTDGTIAPPKSDIYCGVHAGELSRPVRDALGHHIMPSTMQHRPLAPNFFVEIKGPDGNSSVAERQIRYDGAVGARGMHSLQSYGEEGDHGDKDHEDETQGEQGEQREQGGAYDGQAYTFSSCYHAGMLQLYAHHPTTSAMAGPQGSSAHVAYHTTELRSFAMKDSRETFVHGATAFRNARDLAKQHRGRFIQAANEAVDKRTSRVSRVFEDIAEAQGERDEGEEEEEKAEERERVATLGDDPLLPTPVTSSLGTSAPGSTLLKQAKRRHSSSSAAVSASPSPAPKRFRHSYS